MATDLRTDSADYRTELLSPAAAVGAENSVVLQRGPSWRLNFDDHPLPESRKDSFFNFGCREFVLTVNVHSLDFGYLCLIVA